MGVARKIELTEEGANHPLHAGKPRVFDGLVSHDDEVTKIPLGGKLLSGNSHTRVQSLTVTHKKGTFWATQFHTEYDVHEMARLIVAREPKLVPMGFFRDGEELAAYVTRLEELFENPESLRLRWQLGIDDDLLDDSIRQCEFINWIERLVIPNFRGQAVEV